MNVSRTCGKAEGCNNRKRTKSQETKLHLYAHLNRTGFSSLPRTIIGAWTIDREPRLVGVAVARGRGAHDKNGAHSTQRGWLPPFASSFSSLLLFPYKCRVCDAPPTDRPTLSCRKNTVLPSMRFTPSPLHPLCRPFTVSHSAAATLAFSTIYPRLGGTSLFNPRAAYYAAVVWTGGWKDGSYENGFGFGGGPGTATDWRIFEGFRGFSYRTMTRRGFLLLRVQVDEHR